MILKFKIYSVFSVSNAQIASRSDPAFRSNPKKSFMKKTFFAQTCFGSHWNVGVALECGD